MTNLFSSFSKTQIQQGKTGDCYLLAILDGLMNNGPEGLDMIKALFRQSTDEVIVLRIPRSDLSNNLIGKDLSQYHYYVDTLTDEDVFTIDHHKCAEMERNMHGVQTDALAVKILERVCSYYYRNHWQSITTSIAAHSIRKMAIANDAPLRSIQFVQKWLALETHPIVNLNHLFLIKQIFPNLPIYMSMDFEPSRHSYQFEALISADCNMNNAQLQVWNPWNNQVLETHSFTSILNNRHPEFHLIKTHVTAYQLACILLEELNVLDLLIKIKPYDSQDVFLGNSPERQRLLMTLNQHLIAFKHKYSLSDRVMQPLDQYLAKHQLQIESTIVRNVVAVKPGFDLSTSTLNESKSKQLFAPVGNSVFKKIVKSKVPAALPPVEDLFSEHNGGSRIDYVR